MAVPRPGPSSFCSPSPLAQARLFVDQRSARALGTNFVARNRVAFACTLAAEIFDCYRGELDLPRPAAPPPGTFLLFEETLDPAPIANFAVGLFQLDDIRAAGQLIGTAYTAALPSEHRARHGVFYTPAPLVDRLLDMAEDAGTNWRHARVLDPSCGGGAFLVAAAGRMARALADLEPALALRQIGLRLRGFELDPFGAWLSQAMLEVALAPLSKEAGQPVPPMVDFRDSLDLRPGDLDSFDLVVGNPPYGRVSLAAERRSLFARSLHGHANLFGLFTDAGLRWAAPGGLVAYVTPTSMLSGLYHKSLRALLAREGPPAAVELVAERSGVFDDVLQETMLAVYRRGREMAASAGKIGFLSVGLGGQVAVQSAGTFDLPDDPEAPWLLPRAPGQVALTRRLRAMPHRLSDYGYGVSTGPLVWNRFKPQLGVTWQKGAYPVVWAESVSADGCFRWRAERRNHAPWFTAKLPRDAWLLVDRPCVLLQRTTAKEQARRLIAAELPEAFILRHGAAVVENHLNMVRPIVAAPAVSSGAIVALLNSRAADDAFRCMNGSVAVSAFELEEMPVPSPAVMRRVGGLVSEGASWQRIESLIAGAYAPAAGKS